MAKRVKGNSYKVLDAEIHILVRLYHEYAQRCLEMINEIDGVSRAEVDAFDPDGVEIRVGHLYDAHEVVHEVIEMLDTYRATIRKGAKMSKIEVSVKAFDQATGEGYTDKFELFYVPHDEPDLPSTRRIDVVCTVDCDRDRVGRIPVAIAKQHYRDQFDILVGSQIALSRALDAMGHTRTKKIEAITLMNAMLAGELIRIEGELQRELYSDVEAALCLMAQSVQLDDDCEGAF